MESITIQASCSCGNSIALCFLLLGMLFTNLTNVRPFRILLLRNNFSSTVRRKIEAWFYFFCAFASTSMLHGTRNLVSPAIDSSEVLFENVSLKDGGVATFKTGSVFLKFLVGFLPLSCPSFNYSLFSFLFIVFILTVNEGKIGWVGSVDAIVYSFR